MARADDLTETENLRIGFLVYAEEVGDATLEQYNLGMVILCNEIMFRLGLLLRPYTLNDMYQHRRNMLRNLN